MKIRKLTTSTIWASLGIIFVGICFYYFLLFPTKTATLAGSSAHWKAEDFVQITILDRGWHSTSVDELKVWWTGTSDEAPSEIRYQCVAPFGSETGHASGPFYPWTTGDATNQFYTNQSIKNGMDLTITWDGTTETMHLQKR